MKKLRLKPYGFMTSRTYDIYLQSSLKSYTYVNIVKEKWKPFLSTEIDYYFASSLSISSFIVSVFVNLSMASTISSNRDGSLPDTTSSRW